LIICKNQYLLYRENKNNRLIISKEFNENSFEKADDLGKLFNNSFGNENLYMFQDG
jgi:hypothetical protein